MGWNLPSNMGLLFVVLIFNYLFCTSLFKKQASKGTIEIMYFYRPSLNRDRGFTLVETLVGVAVFLLIAVSSWQAFGAILEGVKIVRIKQTALNIANEQIEIIHNLHYIDVGIIGGLPNGKISHLATTTRSNLDFLVTTTIRNIDDPFDGVIGGSPNDTSPSDNKLVEVEVACFYCGVAPIVLTTRIAPLSLETTGNNGALFVQVFNSLGIPLEGADIHIENNQLESPITIDDVTGANGVLQIVDAPTGTEAYQITVSKNGFSTERTYAIGDPSNPSPDRIHSNVVTGQVTQVSFSIDALSDLTVTTRRNTCSRVPSVDFDLKGSKTIGLNVFKYDNNHTTNGSGDISISNLEWDTYTFDITDSSYYLAGANPIVPFDLAAGSNQHIDLILENANANALLVKVRDGATGLPLADAEVEIEKGATILTEYTGQGFLTQSDWSGGGGQENYMNETKYLSQDGNIETGNPSGELNLVQVGGIYALNGELTSSVFDIGTATNFQILDWVPGGQPVETGADPVRFQVATNIENTATSTWNFVGPDGTNSSYFTAPGQSFSSSHDGHRYLQYKVYMQTAVDTHTPTISDVSFTFSSSCTPAGQTYFDNLTSGDYKITVTKSGYQTFIQENLTVGVGWQDLDILLTP